MVLLWQATWRFRTVCRFNRKWIFSPWSAMNTRQQIINWPWWCFVRSLCPFWVISSANSIVISTNWKSHKLLRTQQQKFRSPFWLSTQTQLPGNSQRFFSRSRQSEKGNIQKSVKKGNEIMQGSKSVVIQTRQDQNTEKKTLNTSCARNRCMLVRWKELVSMGKQRNQSPNDFLWFE